MLIPFGVLSSAGAAVGFESDYELISTTVLGTATSEVVFSSLATYASTYKHLQIRAVTRTTSSASYADNVRIRINGQTSTYAWHGIQIFGDNSLNGVGASNSNGSLIAPTAGNLATANVFGAQVIDILDAFSASKNKTFRALGGQVQGTTNENNLGFSSGARFSTDSITSIELSSWSTTPDFIAGSRFSLYGIKG